MTQKKVSSREIRRVLGAAAPTIQQLAHNDGVSQKKITALEARAEGHAKRIDRAENILLAMEARITDFRALPFWQRVRWIFRGEA